MDASRMCVLMVCLPFSHFSLNRARSLAHLTIPNFFPHPTPYPSFLSIPVRSPVIRIDCGSALSSIINGHIWMPDTNFVGGKAAVVSSVGALQGALNPIEDTLRAFPSDTGGCYTVPVVPWRYLVRLGFAYYNFDGKNSPPTFNVTLQGSPVATMFMVQYETGARMGQGAVYKDFITPAWHGIVRVCVRPFESRYSALQANASSTPLINSVEILPVDAQAYDSKRTMLNSILATAVRINLGGPSFGPDPGDPSFRIWQKDELPVAPGLVMSAPPGVPIAGALSPPDYLPSQIFATARLASQLSGGAFALQLPIWPMNLAHDYLMRVYVSEIQAGVNKAGMRVFDIVVGATMPDGSLVRLNEPTKFDILSVAPPFTAVSLTYALTLRNLPTYSQALVIGVQTLQGSRLPGLMCGLELFEIIPVGELKNVSAPGSNPQPQPGQHPRPPSSKPRNLPPHHPPTQPSPPLMVPPAVISNPPPLPLLYPPPLYPNGQINTNSNSAPSSGECQACAPLGSTSHLLDCWNE